MALMSCSPDEGGKGAKETPAEPDRSNAMAAAEGGNATTPGSAFQDEFRTAYASVLWSMMVLRWCDRRWVRPEETAAAEVRLKAIDEQAIKLGLKPQMDQAARDNAQQMATMRLDVHCSGGFERFYATANQSLSRMERLMPGRQRSEL